MSKFLSIKEAADYLGVSTSTMRRWETEGKLLPDKRTVGKQRRYSLDKLVSSGDKSRSLENKITIAYARVSSHDQKADLERQRDMLEMFCAQKGWSYSVISDLGSGMNYRKKGLKVILNKILNKEIDRLVLTHKDRLLRFGAELVFAMCEAQNVEIVIMNQGSEPSFEEELAKDVLEIITVFSARLYGSRSRKNKVIMDKLKKVVE